MKILFLQDWILSSNAGEVIEDGFKELLQMIMKCILICNINFLNPSSMAFPAFELQSCKKDNFHLLPVHFYAHHDW